MYPGFADIIEPRHSKPKLSIQICIVAMTIPPATLQEEFLIHAW